MNSYIFRVEKPVLEKRVYQKRELLRLGVQLIPSSEIDSARYFDLYPYCTKVKVQLLGNGSGCHEVKDHGSQDKPEAEEEAPFKEHRTETQYAFFREELRHWKDRDDIHAFFTDSYPLILPGAYYLLDAPGINSFNESGKADWGQLPREKMTSEAARFYYETK